MMLDSSHLSPDRGLPDQWLKTKCSQVSISQQQTNGHQQSFSLHLRRVQSHPLRHYSEPRTIPSDLARPSRSGWNLRGELTCHVRAARHSIRALQAVEKGEELVARSIATGRAIQRRCPGERLLLHRQGRLQIDLGRFNRFVAEPQGNHRPVHARLQ
jgi:hypothetical protein